MAVPTDKKLFAKGFPSGVTPLCFITAGNCSRKVSYSAWHHGYPYRQETIRERFPIRLGTMAIPTDRKLFAKGFLSDLALWLSLPTGNCSQRFPIRHDTMAVLTNKKLFAKGFLSGVTLWLSLPTGNCSQKVSYSAWHHGCPYRQETIRERFPTRRDTMAILTDRKLFAKGFLFDMTLWLSLPTGNCLRKVSYPAWHHGCHYRQETIRERFPIRLDTMAVPTDRKLFAKGFLFGLAPWLSLPTGNCSQKVSYPA